MNIASLVSGGVDSSLLAYLAATWLGRENTIAVTVKSPLTYKRDLDDAHRIADMLRLKHLIVEVNELLNHHVKLNTPLRCYHCKKMRISAIKNMLAELGLSDYKLIDGTNADEVYGRPGIKALREEGVLSPYLIFNISKSEIRRMAYEVHLDVASKPPNSCKATRMEVFIELNLSVLSAVEELEEELRELLGDVAIRARVVDGYVRVEIPEDVMKIAYERRQEINELAKAKGFNGALLSLKPYVRS